MILQRACSHRPRAGSPVTDPADGLNAVSCPERACFQKRLLPEEVTPKEGLQMSCAYPFSYSYAFLRDAVRRYTNCLSKDWPQRRPKTGQRLFKDRPQRPAKTRTHCNKNDPKGGVGLAFLQDFGKQKIPRSLAVHPSGFFQSGLAISPKKSPRTTPLMALPLSCANIRRCRGFRPHHGLPATKGRRAEYTAHPPLKSVVG